MRLYSKLKYSLTFLAVAFASDPSPSTDATQDPFWLVEQFFTMPATPGPEFVDGQGYWGREYVTAYEDERNADYFGYRLYEALQHVESQEYSGLALPKLLNEFKSTHDATLQAHVQGGGHGHANAIRRFEIYESFRTAVMLIRSKGIEDSGLRNAIAVHILLNASSSAEEFHFCTEYCMEKGAAWSGLNCADNYESFKVLKALSELGADERFSNFIAKIRLHKNDVSRNLSLVDSLSVIIDPISAYCQGYGEAAPIFTRIDDALQQVAFGVEEIEAGL